MSLAQQSQDYLDQGGKWTDPFRRAYRELSEDKKNALYSLETKANELSRHYDLLPKGREAALAMTNLEQSVMWATKALTG